MAAQADTPTHAHASMRGFRFDFMLSRLVDMNAYKEDGFKIIAVFVEV